MATTKKAVVKDAPAANKAVAKKLVAKKEADVVAKPTKRVKPKWSDVPKRDLAGFDPEDLIPAQYYINKLGTAITDGNPLLLQVLLEKAWVAAALAAEMNHVRANPGLFKDEGKRLARGKYLLDNLEEPQVRKEMLKYFAKRKAFDLGKRRDSVG